MRANPSAHCNTNEKKPRESDAFFIFILDGIAVEDDEVKINDSQNMKSEQWRRAFSLGFFILFIFFFRDVWQLANYIFVIRCENKSHI